MAIHCVGFRNTIFNGQSISKLYVLSQMDSLYHADLKDSRIESKIDPCIYFFQQPMGFEAAKIWKQRQVPLWNANASAGQPLMAHIESGVFNIFNYLFTVQSEYLYNLGIVCKLVAASIGTFVLARLVGVARLYAVVAALAFSFCPYIIREVELVKATWLYPWILSVFVLCSRRVSLFKATILGAFSGYVCATIHPECSFNSIVLSCLFVLTERCVQKDATFNQKLKGVSARIAYLAVVGLIALATCSPVLIPFVEYLQNSDCYKFHNVVPPTVPFKAFLLDIINPILGGNSPFLGFAALPIILVGVWFAKRNTWPLYINLFFSIMVMCAIGPFQWLFTIAPFNHLEPIYVQPWAFMLLSVGMAESTQSIFARSSRKGMTVLALSICCVVVLPILLKDVSGLFDGLVWDAGMEAFAININAFRRDIILAACAVVVIFCSCILGQRAHSSRVGPYQLGLLFLGFGLFSELSIARNAMPPHAAFNFPTPDAVKVLQQQFHNDRMIATGRHLMLPNINCVWDLSDFRSFNSLYPPRFLIYQKYCGARKYYATHYRYEDGLTRFTDLASVKTVLSRSAVWGSETALLLAESAHTTIADLDGGHQVFVSDPMLDAKNSAVFANARVTAPSEWLANYACQFVALDKANREVWASDIFPLQFYMQNVQSNSVDLVAHWCVPPNFRACDLKYMVRFSHNLSYAPVFPLSTKFGQVRNMISCGDSTKLAIMPSGCNDRFILQKQFADGLRLYRATQALPAAFIAFDARPVKTTDIKADLDAFAATCAPDFDPQRQVVLEGYAGKWCNTGTPRAIRPVEIQRPHANKVVIETNDAGLLVLNDTCYPGWQATVDGMETPIYRANTYFRAVEIPSGRHTVAFEYKPKSFQQGLFAFVICWAVLLLLNLLVLFKRFRQGQSYQPLT